MSESQERMMAVVRPADIDAFMAICAKWDVPATVIGEVTDTGRLVMTWNGETIVDIPPGTAADEGPVYERPVPRARRPGRAQRRRPRTRLRPARRPARHAAAAARLAQPGVEGVGDLSVRPVRALQHRARPARRRRDAAHLRGDAGAEPTTRGIALATDGNGRYARLDPYAGAQLALAEAYRNVAVTGAKPLAVTNCLNFGSPEDPEVMWQFAEAVRGLADACRTLGVPVTGGNVSFYNQTGSDPDPPDPGRRRARRDRRRGQAGARPASPAKGCAVALLGETERGVRRLGVGARRPRPPRRPAAAGEPGGRAGAGAVLVEAARRGPAGGLARPVRRRAGHRAGRVLPGARRRRHGGAERRRRSPTCSASRRPGRWSRSGRSPSTSSPRSAPSTRCPATASAPPAATSLVVEDVLEVPVEELRETHTGTLPALFG